MSIATITAAQRVEVRDACLTASLAMQRFTQSGTTPRADETAEVTPLLADAAAALVVAGATGLPATSAVVTNGGTVNVENSAGALDSPATAVVAGGVLTGVNLAATKTIVTQAQAITVTDQSASPTTSGTATVVAGVLTAVTLAAATDAIVQQGNGVVIQNSANAAVAGTHTATVSGGSLSKVNLAATVGTVINAVKQSGWTVTGSGTFFTPTVVAGVCTGGVLSAS